MIANDIMSDGYKSVHKNTTLSYLLDIIIENNIEAAYVTDDDNRYLGYISCDDLLHRDEIGTISQSNRFLHAFISLERASNVYIRQHALYVSELISRPDIGRDKNTDVKDIINLMEHENISQVPITQDGKIIGSINKIDILKALRKAVRLNSNKQSTDQEIYNSIHSQFEGLTWADGISCEVNNGIATLSGNILNNSIRSAAHVAIENVSGVTKIIDNMTLLLPEMPL